MFTQVALAVQVYDLTGSTLAVGLLGAAEFMPIVLLALVGGALADAFDRRKLIWGAELTASLVSAALLVNALLPYPQLWVLYVAAAMFAGASAVLRPPLDALLPRLVERDELKAASAIEGRWLNVATIAGPALAGVLIAATGVSYAYAIDVVDVRRLADRVRVHAHAAAAAGRGAAVAARRDRGPASTRARARSCSAPTLIDMNAMFFGMPFALFPALARALRRDAGRRAAVGGARRRRAGRDADQRLGGARAPQRARDRVRGRRLGRRSSRSSGSPDRCGSRC